MTVLRQALSDELPEDELDRSLRPRRLADFVGQEALKDQLGISIAAAARRGEALDHVLLAGPPGLGKTSLAQIIAAELEVPFVQTVAPALERKGDIAAFLNALEARSVFFIDEIHRLPPALEEQLYTPMEDGRVEITVGQGVGAKLLSIPVKPFTLVGATTRTGLLTTPLRNRFGIQHRLEHYAPVELARIVRRSARLLGAEIEDDGAIAIAQRSRGTPRIANHLLRRVRDFAEVRDGGVVTAGVAASMLELMEVDRLGLERPDRELLRVLCEKQGRPIGLSTLAAAVAEEQGTIEDVHEPYLLQCGLIERTPRGRVATPLAFAHLGLEPPGPPTLM